MTPLRRAAAALDRAEEVFIALALAAMTIMTFVQVVLRYLFHTGLVWSLEATTYSFAWLVVVGMAYGVRTRAHIASDLLTRALPPRARPVAAGLALAVCLAYCALMFVGSLAFVEGLVRLGSNAQDIALPRWLLASILPIGFALLALRLVQAGWRQFMPGDRRIEDGGPP
jgi:C4-dicarboxylate transporter, DctQ subunit